MTNAAAGAAIYHPAVLRVYDHFVHGFSNAHAWRCPTRELRALYDQSVSGVHLDVGVGSGYFLDACQFPQNEPRVTLVDLNVDALGFTAQRIRRYQPKTYQANVLEPLELEGGPFRSIALMYVLHCLPGPLSSKAVVFRHVGRHLSEDGVLFGATILGTGQPTPRLGRLLQRLYNARGIFGNAEDSLEGLELALKAHFERTRVWVHGSVALFEARGYRPAEGAPDGDGSTSE